MNHFAGSRWCLGTGRRCERRGRSRSSGGERVERKGGIKRGEKILLNCRGRVGEGKKGPGSVVAFVCLCLSWPTAALAGERPAGHSLRLPSSNGSWPLTSPIPRSPFISSSISAFPAPPSAFYPCSPCPFRAVLSPPFSFRFERSCL